MTALATASLLIGVGLVVVGTMERRRLWRRAEPFAGGDRAAPEPVIVPARVLYAIYLGVALIMVGLVLVALALR
jgi:hypothetical protein